MCRFDMQGHVEESRGEGMSPHDEAGLFGRLLRNE